MLRKGNRFSDYNFRMLARRRVKERFREAREETSEDKLKFLFEDAQKNSEMLDRQTVVGELYRWTPVTFVDQKHS
ncbi:hypothetical protein NDN08_002266 [Rhodosorus marinus]|uniref:Complex 1 LYR protein domain-containing protein n=1 Tax=Rhodosorus marinus TaxID=101924 RepID=A0AAV8UW42_9RHOD|nr:hypothetical protein NDN08_002266 [Rhodosorus marinus]